MARIEIGDKYIDKKVKEKAYEEKPYKKLDNETAKMMAESMKADIPPEQEEAVQKQIMVKSTAANTQPTAREQIARDIASQNQAKPEQQPQQKQLAPEQREQVREGLSQGFKDALLYFGPRLGAMILGGSEAAELTDEALQGWEAHQAGLQNRRLKERDMALREKGDKEEDPRLAYKKERDQLMDKRYAQEQQAKSEQMQQKKMDSITDLNEQLSKFGKAESYLSDPSIVGSIGGSLGKIWDRYVGSKAGDRRQVGRKLLEELRVDEGLANTMKLKGAINQKEFETLFKPVPDLLDDNDVWQGWIQSKKDILNKGLIKLQGGSPSQQFSAGQTVRSKTTGKMYKIMPDGSKQEIR